MRAMLRASGFVLALTALIVVGRLWAESKARKPAKPTPRTRVALLNLNYVMRNYDKYKHSQEELRGVIKPFEKQKEKVRAQREKLQQAMRQADLAPAKKEKIEKKIKLLQRQIEDIDIESKIGASKESDHQMKILYLDVLQAAQRYAMVRNFDLLLHYNDATTEEESNDARSIGRKLNTGGLMPIYAAPGIDITKDVTDELNRKEGAAQ